MPTGPRFAQAEAAPSDCAGGAVFRASSPRWPSGVAPRDGRFEILITNDGGRSWARIPADRLPAALPNEGAFAGSGTNVAVLGANRAWIGTGAAARCRVLRTDDGGRTWKIADTPVAASASAGIFSIAFRDARRGRAGWGVGEDGRIGKLIWGSGDLVTW